MIVLEAAPVHPLDIMELQFFDEDGELIFRLPDPVVLVDGVPTVRLNIPHAIYARVRRVTEITE